MPVFCPKIDLMMLSDAWNIWMMQLMYFWQFPFLLLLASCEYSCHWNSLANFCCSVNLEYYFKNVGRLPGIHNAFIKWVMYSSRTISCFQWTVCIFSTISVTLWYWQAEAPDAILFSPVISPFVLQVHLFRLVTVDSYTYIAILNRVPSV